VGYGSMMLAAHRGIYGLGLLLTLGTAASLVASFVGVFTGAAGGIVLPRSRQPVTPEPVPRAATATST